MSVISIIVIVALFVIGVVYLNYYCPKASIYNEYKIVPTGARKKTWYGQVALDGDVAVVASDNSKNVYSYRWNGNAWKESRSFAPSDAPYNMNESSVDTDGEIVVFGIPEHREHAGSAFLFKWNGHDWKEVATLFAAERVEYEYFASDVAVSDGVVVVGNRIGGFRKDRSEHVNGAAYVFEHQNGEWLQTAKFTSDEKDAFEFFGSAVDIDNGRIIVASSSNRDIKNKSGFAAIYEKVNGEWIEQQKLCVDNNSDPTSRYFGSVSISGNRAIIGADKYGGGGRVYIFEYNDSAWVLSETLSASDKAHDQRFGFQVSIDQDTIVVGDYSEDSDKYRSGAVFVYTYINSQWVETEKIKPRIGQKPVGAPRTVHMFGSTVDISAGRLIAGAKGDGTNGKSAGAAFIYAPK